MKRILLVEPEQVLAEITAFRLELLGYSVVRAASAEEALRQAAEVQPDLVLTSLVLPGLDGAGLIERLASDDETSDLPVIVLSTDADLDRVQSVYSLGASDFLVVPFHMETLEQKVARHTSASREKKRFAEAADSDA